MGEAAAEGGGESGLAHVLSEGTCLLVRVHIAMLRGRRHGHEYSYSSVLKMHMHYHHHVWSMLKYCLYDGAGLLTL